MKKWVEVVTFSLKMLLGIMFCTSSILKLIDVDKFELYVYSYDFFSWLNGFWVPEDFFDSMFHRVLVAVPILVLFIVAVSVYVALQLGTSPYDAMPYVLDKLNNHKIPAKVWRICWDLGMCIIGILLGSKAGVVTFIMAFAFGPTISWIQVNVIAKIWKE